jgi:hypothetical protein
MKKTKRYDEGGVAEGANPNIDDETRARAMASVEPGMKEAEPAENFARRAAPKQRVVSKEELEKSGMTLRDFLNKERGLTRRGSAAPTPSAPVPTARPTTPPIAEAKAASAKYETPYDRMNRQNREASAAKAETAEETRRLANRAPARGRGVIDTSNIDSKTLLPKRSGYAKGGSVSKASNRADGIAQRGKTKGRMI